MLALIGFEPIPLYPVCLQHTAASIIHPFRPYLWPPPAACLSGRPGNLTLEFEHIKLTVSQPTLVDTYAYLPAWLPTLELPSTIISRLN